MTMLELSKSIVTKNGKTVSCDYGKSDFFFPSPKYVHNLLSTKQSQANNKSQGIS